MGFVKGRQASDRVRPMIDLFKQAENRKVPSLLLALEADKAFDRADWGYLWEFVICRICQNFDSKVSSTRP